MKKYIVLYLLILFNLMSFAQSKINIVPQPQMLKMGTGSFSLNENVTIQFQQNDLEGLANYTQSQLKNRFGIQTSINKKSNRTISFSIEKDSTDWGDEGYTLVINPTQVKITANSSKGVFYGIQTFLQVIPFEIKEGIPSLFIKDKPRFAWREMMLDVSRSFFTVKEVKEFLDIMSTYKMNVFHWHLTDDQGWRLEIKKYPKLTSVGGFRNGTIFGSRPGEGNHGTLYGGFYTQEDIKDVVKYAQERFITVIPEIDLPGHSSAAIAAYPQLSCFPDESTKIPDNTPWVGSRKGKQVQQTWGIFEDVFCPTEYTFNFLENVLKEVMELFPSKYIHIGGDEVPKSSWERSEFSQNLIKENDLKDEEGLQGYFIKRIAKFLELHGKTIIGWDEILEGGLAPNSVVQTWNGKKPGIEAAQLHHDVIMSPANIFYLNRYQGHPNLEPLSTYTPIIPLKMVYDYNPMPTELNSDDKKFILGAGGAIWTEFVNTNDYLQYMLLPRMLAISEITWTDPENKSWDNFIERMPYQFELFDKKEWNYSSKNLEYGIKK